MLRMLTVNNFALIEQVSLEFTGGLNIITGETGAGKSILIDALSTVLGYRTSSEYIRSGQDFFKVEAIFDIQANRPAQELLNAHDIIMEEDGTLIISRKFTRAGKNNILINGNHATLSFLKQLGTMLVDVHGQHENQALLRPETYMTLVDTYNASRIKPLLNSYLKIYSEWSNLLKQIEAIKKDDRERAQRIDMLSWQVKEIAAAKLHAGEEEELSYKIKILANREKIIRAAQAAYKILNESELATVSRELETVIRYDDKLRGQLDAINQCLFTLDDVRSELRNYLEQCEYAAEELESLQQRMDVIYKLKRKYGISIEEILEYYKQAASELDKLMNQDEYREKLYAQLNMLEAKLKLSAKELSIQRCLSAKSLADEVIKHIHDLAMPQAVLDIIVSPTENYGPNGRDQIEILFSANPGEDVKPLYKVASGGELSRIALAIKTVTSSAEAAGTMVFDEVDAGIGGKTAYMVAEKIAMAARDRQVFCITHLPQIACMADTHFVIEKDIIDNVTYTNVKLLNEKQRISEVSRMISGDDSLQSAVDNARQMIELCRQKKEIWKNKAQA